MSQKRISGQDFTVGLMADGGTGVPFSSSNPIPVSITGGASPGIEDLLYTDDTGAQFIFRDNGATPPVFTAYLIPAGTVYVVGANPVPYAVKNVAVANLPGTLGQKTAAGSTSVVLSSDGPFSTNFGLQADAAATTDTGSFSLVAFIKRGLQNWTALLAKIPALGGAAPAASVPVTEASISGAVAMTVGTTYAAGRQLAINCTVAGNVSITFTDTSVYVFPVNPGFSAFPFAVTAVNASGTTATATYANFK